MLLKPLSLAVGLAAVTQAFLVPPEISETDAELMDFAGADAGHIAEKMVVDLACPNCPPLPFRRDHGKNGKPGSSHLELTFTIDSSPEGDRLLANGFELYPNSDPFNSLLTAPQVPDKPHKHHMKHMHHEDAEDGEDQREQEEGEDGEEDEELKERRHKRHRKHRNHEEHEEHEHTEAEDSKALKSHHKTRPPMMLPPVLGMVQRLGFGLQVQPVTKGEEDNMELVVIDLQIIEVGPDFIDGIPNVQVNLIKTPTNQLMIANIGVTESQFLGTPVDNQEECTTMLCKWKAMVSEQMNKMKPHGCGGMKGKHHHNHHPHMSGPPHMLGEKHNHSWGQLFRMFTHHILAPVAVGIVAGVSVSIFGMMVGTLLVGLWRKLVRGQSFFPRHHSRRHFHGRLHKAATKEATAEDEKSGLMEHQDPPPSYDEEANKADA